MKDSLPIYTKCIILPDHYNKLYNVEDTVEFFP